MAPWSRVNHQHPCLVCGHDDWCTLGEKASCCMRMESAHPCKNGGWLHFFTDMKVPPKPARLWKPTVAQPPIIDANLIFARWHSQTDPRDIQSFASHLGVTSSSLHAVGCAWSSQHQAWAFPMKDGLGNIIGIRLRSQDGKKWAVTGSRQGIFIPDMPPSKTAYICEGPTDLAATLSLGLYGIGRPSCLGGIQQLKETIHRLRIREVIILSDNDGPGIQGAQRLGTELPVRNVICMPPTKDIREFIQIGGTSLMLMSIIKNLVWNAR